MMQTEHQKRTVVFLGPQLRVPTVRDALIPLLESESKSQDPRIPTTVALVTAGWEEREAEDLELGEHLQRPVENLDLHARALSLFDEDPELLVALQRRHDRLNEMHQLYRVQLRHLVPVAEILLRRDGTPDLIEPEREVAFANLRALDAHHLSRVHEIHCESAAALSIDSRESVARHRQEIARILSRSRALCIAGGHVGVLYNRLWLFDVLARVPETMPIVAWSAGAMVLSDRIVLFHDNPPEGKGHAEVWGAGFGFGPGIVPFPHARRRLKLDDPVRIQLLSRRFSDALCVAIDDDSRVTWDGRSWSVGDGTYLLTTDGDLEDAGADHIRQIGRDS